jgi:glutaredoxin 3
MKGTVLAKLLFALMSRRRQERARIHSSRPVPGAADRRLTKDVPMPEVEIYTQPYCPYCTRALRLLAAKGVAFREIAAPHGTPERAEAIRRSAGRTTVPQIFIDGEPVGGADDLDLLDEAGELDRRLGIARATAR